MRVFIAGIDGYLGWTLAQSLTTRGHLVAGADKLLRREWVQEVGGISAIPIASYKERLQAFEDDYSYSLDFRIGDLTNYKFVRMFLQEFQPDAIVHLGQMPSAPYSMIDRDHSVWTQQNNLTTNLNLLWAIKEVCPQAHLVKLGTMGEYGTPDIDIPEGFFDVEYRRRQTRLPFPRQAGSFYHLSKVHDSHNTQFVSQVWGIRASDIMQGIVYGTRIEEMGEEPRLRTRLDFDTCFGTVINRFCCQAVIGHPLTLMGSGEQTRSFLSLRDSMQCLNLIIENPPAIGEYRVFNQFDTCYSITELAETVKDVGASIGLSVAIEQYPNPRLEAEEHYYNPERQHLIDLGYQPSGNLRTEIQTMLEALLPYQDRIRSKQHCLIPNIRWDGQHRVSMTNSQ